MKINLNFGFEKCLKYYQCIFIEAEDTMNAMMLMNTWLDFIGVH